MRSNRLPKKNPRRGWVIRRDLLAIRAGGRCEVCTQSLVYDPNWQVHPADPGRPLDWDNARAMCSACAARPPRPGDRLLLTPAMPGGMRGY